MSQSDVIYNREQFSFQMCLESGDGSGTLVTVVRDFQTTTTTTTTTVEVYYATLLLLLLLLL